MEKDIVTTVKEDLFKKESETKTQHVDNDKIQNQTLKNKPNDDSEKSIEQILSELERTKDDLKQALLELAENDTYKEEFSLLNKIPIILEVQKPITADAFYEIIAELSDVSINKFEFIYGIYTVAATLKKYKNVELNEHCKKQLEEKLSKIDDLEKEKLILKCKADFIEKNIPLPILSALEKEVIRFNRFVNLFSRKEILDFL